jgi:transcription elongation GreA/GreB family factor
MHIFAKMDNLKKQLHSLCAYQIKQRIEAVELAIKSAQEASDDDTKSSAGDKYETGREMMQQEEERNVAQLTEAKKLMAALNNINAEHKGDVAEAGSVINTDQGNFYLAVSAGMLTVDNINYVAVSPASPIGVKMRGLKANDEFNLNGKNYLIKKVC